MHKADFAERILSLAIPSDRAAAIVGDLVEDETIGPFGFWVAVFETAVVQAFRRIVEAPSATAGFALRAVAAEWGLMLAGCVAYLLALWVAVSVATVSFHSKLPASAVSSLSWCISNIAVPVALGVWIARRNPGRTAPAILTLSAMHAGIDLLAAVAIAALGAIGVLVHLDIIVVLRFIDWASVSSALHSAALYATLYPVLVLAGALFSRPAPAALRT